MNEPRDMLDASDLPDEGVWTRITPDHELMALPSELPPELIHPAPDLLNTHELRWEAFEKLIYRMARDEGALNTHLYGDRGQAQHGIDIVAFPREGRPTVYQAKRQQEFLAGDLNEAVERYATDRHLDAQRIVVAVACAERRLDLDCKLIAPHGFVGSDYFDPTVNADISSNSLPEPAQLGHFRPEHKLGMVTASAAVWHYRPHRHGSSPQFNVTNDTWCRQA
jgi:hypothetical protein